MKIIKFYCVKTDKPEIIFTPESIKEVLPIMWNYKGLIGIVPIETIQNIKNAFDNHAKTKQPALKTLKVYWSECIPMTRFV